MRRLFCAIVCTALVASGTPAPARADEQRAVLTLRVNTVMKSEATVTLKDDDVLVRRADLIDAGLRAFAFNRSGKADDLVALSALKPDLTFHVDDVNLTLDLTVATSHLDSTLVNFRRNQDLTLSKPVKSAFLNYSLASASGSGTTYSTEFGTHIGAGMFTATQSFSASNINRSAITQWVVDSPNRAQRTTAGDVLVSTGDFGDTVAIAGIGVQRFFGMNPDLVRTVLPQISGNALTPSTADVYVNGVLVQHQMLPPGQFTFANVPAGEGPNSTTVVVTDAFGRQRTYDNYFYGADSLLARGISDFDYAAGFLHSQFGEQTGHGPAAAGRYQIGLTDDITAGGRFEISQTALSAGPQVSLRLKRGILSAAAALSRSQQRMGEAGLLSYQFMNRGGSGDVSIAYQSPHYASLGLQPPQDRSTLNASASFSRQLSARAAVGVSYLQQNDRDNGNAAGWHVFQNTMLSESTQLQISEDLGGAPGGQRRFGLSTQLNFIPRRGLNASFSTVTQSGTTSESVQVQRAATSQTPSLGYTVSASGGAGAASAFLSSDYRTQYGTYLTDAGLGSGGRSLAVTAAGGLVFIGGKLFPTQSVSDSYALVDSGGLSGVRILANNVVAGRTNKAGYLLVPSLGSYYTNDISIASADAPLDYSIEEQTQHVAPMYHSGAIVRFGVSRVRPVTGMLVVRTGTKDRIPAFGVLEVQSGTATDTSDIGEDGAFYFDKLTAGAHPAAIKFKDGACTFTLTVPQTNATFVKLGTVVCTNGGKS